MTDAEIETFRKRLNKLTTQLSVEEQEEKIRPELKKLAREVGASTWVLYVSNEGRHMTGEADTSTLIHNIHQALQTASIANMCRTATEASKSASKRFWIFAAIALASAVAACISAVAACVMAAVQN